MLELRRSVLLYLSWWPVIVHSSFFCWIDLRWLPRFLKVGLARQQLLFFVGWNRRFILSLGQVQSLSRWNGWSYWLYSLSVHLVGICVLKIKALKIVSLGCLLYLNRLPDRLSDLTNLQPRYHYFACGVLCRLEYFWWCFVRNISIIIYVFSLVLLGCSLWVLF